MVLCEMLLTFGRKDCARSVPQKIGVFATECGETIVKGMHSTQSCEVDNSCKVQNAISQREKAMYKAEERAQGQVLPI